MKNTKKSIIAISIRLVAKNQAPDYYPFIEAPKARYFFLRELYAYMENQEYCFSIQQHLDEIILVLDAENPNTYTSLPALHHHILQSRQTCNGYIQKHNWNYKLQVYIAADAGQSEKIILPASNRFPTMINWTGLHVDRVSTLTKEMSMGIYPSKIITHSLYKRLSSEEQKKYSTLYYIRHICCYSIDK